MRSQHVRGNLFVANLPPEFSDDRLAEAFALEQDGQTKQSIAAVQALLDSGSLNAPDTGKAWNILALAYESRGDLADAQGAYERAIRTLSL